MECIPAEGGVDGVGPVGGTHDNHVCTGLEAVHKREQLRYDASFHFALCLLALRGDGVDLVDEDDGWRVLLGLLKCLAQVAL